MNGQRIGYARVSSTDQSTDVQEDQLKAAGCSKVFTEKASGVSSANREQLNAALDYAREGDVFVVTRLDRLARSQVDLHALLSNLETVGLRSSAPSSLRSTRGALWASCSLVCWGL